jgi:hypothetical protein
MTGALKASPRLAVVFDGGLDQDSLRPPLAYVAHQGLPPFLDCNGHLDAKNSIHSVFVAGKKDGFYDTSKRLGHDLKNHPKRCFM